MKKIIFNMSTGKSEEVELTAEEIAARTPSVEYLAEIEKAEKDRQIKTEITSDMFIRQFLSMDLKQIDDYLDENVKNVADMREFVKHLAKLVLINSKQYV